ncbi:hypothetical protein JCM10207_000030 [Rhodosporidiobolus poonsookiae]
MATSLAPPLASPSQYSPIPLDHPVPSPRTVAFPPRPNGLVAFNPHSPLTPGFAPSPSAASLGHPALANPQQQGAHRWRAVPLSHVPPSARLVPPPSLQRPNPPPPPPTVPSHPDDRFLSYAPLAPPGDRARKFPVSTSSSEMSAAALREKEREREETKFAQAAAAQQAERERGRTTYRAPRRVVEKEPERAPTPPAPDEPIVSSTLWEDERTIVMQVLVDGHVIARRADNDWVNSTKLLNMAALTRGKRDMYLKNEAKRQVFRRGALHLKGVWLPLTAAERLAHAYNLHDRLYPLFEPELKPFLFSRANRERTTQLVHAARGREALFAGAQKGEEEKGLTQEEKEDRKKRGEELELLLQELEKGLGLDGTDAERNAAMHLVSASAQHGTEHDSYGGEPQPAHYHPSASPFSPVEAAAGPSGYSLGSTPTSATLSESSSTTLSSPHDFRRPDFALALPPRRFPSAEAAALAARRPSMDTGFTHDFRQPVAWFDNPTPPAAQRGEYVSAADLALARRVSVVSAMSVDGAELETLHEEEERRDWRAAGVVASSRPPPVAGGGAFFRRASVPADLRSGAGYIPSPLAHPHIHAQPAPPLFSPFEHHSLARPHSVPPAFEQSSLFTPHAALVDFPTGAPDAAAPPPTVDYSTLLASLQSLASHPAPALPSISPVPSPEHALSLSPLARFQATRLSIDSAAEVVHPQVGLGAGSLVAPHAAVYAASGAQYAWGPAQGGGVGEGGWQYAEKEEGFGAQETAPPAEQLFRDPAAPAVLDLTDSPTASFAHAVPPTSTELYAFPHTQPSLSRPKRPLSPSAPDSSAPTFASALAFLPAPLASSALASSAPLVPSFSVPPPFAARPTAQRSASFLGSLSTAGTKGVAGLAPAGSLDRRASLPLSFLGANRPLDTPLGRRDSLCGLAGPVVGEAGESSGSEEGDGAGEEEEGRSKKRRRVDSGASVDGEVLALGEEEEEGAAGVGEGLE